MLRVTPRAVAGPRLSSRGLAPQCNINGEACHSLIMVTATSAGRSRSFHRELMMVGRFNPESTRETPATPPGPGRFHASYVCCRQYGVIP